jgi:hypothetical protein
MSPASNPTSQACSRIHWNRDAMSIDKTIRRAPDPEQQQAETDRYWLSLSIGERLNAVWEASAAAYAFAAAFNGAPAHDAQRSKRTIKRVQRPQR